MKAILGADEWYPMAELTPETDEWYTRKLKIQGLQVIEITEAEYETYTAACKLVEEMSSMFFSRETPEV